MNLGEMSPFYICMIAALTVRFRLKIFGKKHNKKQKKKFLFSHQETHNVPLFVMLKFDQSGICYIMCEIISEKIK
jgi:hypothetical protein